ncbi:MAG: DNA polymerase IV [FCB group bacterium]|nr:DNA polymerase IV [FCB group bacterium]
MMIEFSPVIVHVDMDAFFAAVEVRNNPHLKGKPVIVGGGAGQRGVVSTCSYEARKFGVHSGMSAVKARRLCPQGVFISSGLRGYVYVSARLQQIFEKYTPIVEPFSVDEASMDITGTEKLFGGPIELVEALKQEIRDQLQLSCSVGIAPSKYLAKLASGLNKPDGLTVLDRDEFKRIYYPRPVDALWGVGESTKKVLAGKGIHTVADLASTDSKLLKGILGKNGEGLSVISQGIDRTKAVPYRERPHDKSMSHETTLGKDLQDPTRIKATVLWLADKVARRLRRRGYIGRTISVKIRSHDFQTITRSHTINHPTDRCDVVFQQAMRLIPKEYGMKIPVRLLGVRMSQLIKIRFNDQGDETLNHKTGESVQLELMVNPQEEEIGRLTEAVDAIRDRYGEKSIKLAGTLLS